MMRGEPADDRHHLLGGLAGAEHGLGAAGAERAVMIDLGEAEVLVGQPAQPRHRRLHVEPPGPHVVEQSRERLAIHRRAA